MAGSIKQELIPSGGIPRNILFSMAVIGGLTGILACIDYQNSHMTTI